MIEKYLIELYPSSARIIVLKIGQFIAIGSLLIKFKK